MSQLLPATVLLLSHLFEAHWLTTIGCSIFANEPGPAHTGQRRNHLGNPSHRLSPNSRGRSHNAVFQQSSLHRWHKAVCHLERSILLKRRDFFYGTLPSSQISSPSHTGGPGPGLASSGSVRHWKVKVRHWKVKVMHWNVKAGRPESESEVMANKSGSLEISA